jgi:hypothetical protein
MKMELERATGERVNELLPSSNHPESEGVSMERLYDLKSSLTRTWCPKPNSIPTEPQKLVQDN